MIQIEQEECIYNRQHADWQEKDIKKQQPYLGQGPVKTGTSNKQKIGYHKQKSILHP